jgi:hypothetical protein
MQINENENVTIQNSGMCFKNLIIWICNTIISFLCQLKLALTSPAGCGRLVGIVRLRTKTTEFLILFHYIINSYLLSKL